jgi:hypothetical protein
LKFYRITLTHNNGESAGFGWRTSERDAKQRVTEWKREGDSNAAEYKVVDIVPTREGILSALHRYASHPDNG